MQTTTKAPIVTKVDNTDTIVVLTKNDFIDILMNTKGATPITFIANTDPKMVKKHRETKTPNPYIGAIKISKVNGIVNFKYEEGVNRRLEKEGKTPDFEAKENWHQAIVRPDGTLTPLCEHKQNGKKYLRFMPINAIETSFELDGQPIDKEILKPYLPAHKPNTNQGLDKPMDFRTYDIDNIKQLKMNKIIYILK